MVYNKVMQKLKEIYIEIACFIQDLKPSTLSIIGGIIFAVAFYNFALFIQANKGEKTKFEGLGKFCTFLLALVAAVFIITCLRY